LQFKASLGKKVCETPISVEKKLDVVVRACHPSIDGKLKIGGSGPGWLGQKVRP
jgi:hypothetical protein